MLPVSSYIPRLKRNLSNNLEYLREKKTKENKLVEDLARIKNSYISLKNLHVYTHTHTQTHKNMGKG